MGRLKDEAVCQPAVCYFSLIGKKKQEKKRKCRSVGVCRLGCYHHPRLIIHPPFSVAPDSADWLSLQVLQMGENDPVSLCFTRNLLFFPFISVPITSLQEHSGNKEPIF